MLLFLQKTTNLVFATASLRLVLNLDQRSLYLTKDIFDILLRVCSTYLWVSQLVICLAPASPLRQIKALRRASRLLALISLLLLTCRF